MPVFAYRAINEDGKEVRGSIDAPDRDAALKAVEDLHLDVLDVTEATRIKQASPVAGATPAQNSFAFEGTDSGGGVHRGTIQAPTKRAAFEKLRSDQKLTLKMLAPMGTLPKYNDPDLAAWQNEGKTVAVPVQPVNTTVPLHAQPKPAVAPKAPSPSPSPAPPTPKPRPLVTFTDTAVPPVKKVAATPPPPKPAAVSGYHSITTTLRLYAGWLLAWYGLFVAVGYYATVRALPWDIPFVQAIYVSPLIFSFTVAIFLFLFLSEVHRHFKGRLILGTILTLLGAGLFVLIRSSL